MSIRQYNTDQMPPLRRNHGPSIFPRDLLLEEDALNNDLLDILREAIKKRKTRLLAAHNTCQLKAARRMEAELRLSAAANLKDTLIDTKNKFELSALELKSSYANLQDGTETKSPDMMGVKDVLTEWQACQIELTSHIDTATAAVRLGQEAVMRSLEEQQGALAHEAECSAIVKGLEDQVDSIIKITGLRADRSIWRIPETLWCQIFGEVIDDASKVTKEERSGSTTAPTLILAAVCYTWRMITHSHPTLWRSILIVPHRFTEIDAKRVQHYVRLSGKQTLSITVDAPQAASSNQVDLIAKCLTGCNPVEKLVIKGSDGVKSIAESLSRVTGSPRQLVIEVSADSPFQRLALPQTITQSIQQLTLKNCAPTGFFRRNRKPWPCSLISLHVDAGSETLSWRTFNAWVVPWITTAKSLDILAKFSSTNPVVDSIQPNPLKELTSIRASDSTLLLFYKSCIYTPSLRSLVIVTSEEVASLRDWITWALDARGGANITSVTVEGGGYWGRWGDYACYISCLPLVESILLGGDIVDPILTGMIAIDALLGDDAPLLKQLEVLTISNYPGEGDKILDFARRHAPADDLGSGSKSRAYALQVKLYNSPNISEGILQQLKELGSIPSHD